MDRTDIFDQDLGEAYDRAGNEEKIKLPLTRLGFEALLAEVAERYSTPADDRARQVLAGYIHHIPNEQDFTQLSILGPMLRKSVANSLTWKIDQEIKEKERAKLAADQPQVESTPSLSVVDSNVQASQNA